MIPEEMLDAQEYFEQLLDRMYETEIIVRQSEQLPPPPSQNPAKTSAYKGVTWDDEQQLWSAKYHQHLGHFKSERQAYRAVKAAKTKAATYKYVGETYGNTKVEKRIDANWYIVHCSACDRTQKLHVFTIRRVVVPHGHCGCQAKAKVVTYKYVGETYGSVSVQKRIDSNWYIVHCSACTRTRRLHVNSLHNHVVKHGHCGCQR